MAVYPNYRLAIDNFFFDYGRICPFQIFSWLMGCQIMELNIPVYIILLMDKQVTFDLSKRD